MPPSPSPMTATPSDGAVLTPTTQTHRRTVAIVAAAIVLGLVVEHIADSWTQPAYIPIADLGIGWLMIGCGLVAVGVRPGQPAGWRLVLAGFLWFVGTFMGGMDGSIERWFGFGFGGYHDLVIAWLALSFPDRSPAWRPSRVILAIAAALYLAQTVARLTFFAPQTFDLTLIDAETALTTVLWLDVARAVAMAAAGIVMLARLARSDGRERRMLAPVLLAGAASMVAAAYGAQYAATVLGIVPPIDDETVVPVAWAFNVIRVAVPLTILYGVLQLRGARSAMAGAVADVGEAPTAIALRDALATALGDDDLQVLAWDHATQGFRATDGAPVSAEGLARLEHDPARRIVRVDAGPEPLAAIVVDRAVAEDPALLQAGVSLTRLVVSGEQQSARIQDQLEDVRASRARIVEAADVERRRIERDLHDGLQQRMVALAMQLRSAEGTADRDDALRAGSAEILAILEDVRELARGIHPAVLTEAGLGAAIQAAADRSPVPAEVDVRLAGHGSPAAQATAYYIVSEALANVAKHAGDATAVWIHADDDDGRIRVMIDDDGPGGADPAGHGLAGLADRVAALGGRFAVGPRPGGGTHILAEVPAA
jgi:signal transduction histidine kinase